MTRIILASKSPRRRELMELLKVPFEVIVSDIDEQINPQNDLVKEIEKLSFQKANAVYKDHQD
ncbi:MAG: Maf family protein, partial [Erysipelotrichaceae bacterium]|nr:Maf family protein [Erysipelotrichaceae bacterium]